MAWVRKEAWSCWTASSSLLGSTTPAWFAARPLLQPFPGLYPHHRDMNLSYTNLSLAHILNILLASGSEEGFISRGFLHSSFFNCLSGTLGLLPLWGKWFLWKCFYPNGDEISHVLSITSVPGWIWISLEWRIWCQMQQGFQSRPWERTMQLLWSNILELLPKPGIFFKGLEEWLLLDAFQQYSSFLTSSQRGWKVSSQKQSNVK